MQKIRILHFTPYFPPHKGGLESHASEWANAWIEGEYGDVITLTSSMGQSGRREESHHSIIPIESIEIVPHFPCPKFWKGDFWRILREVRRRKPELIITRTRFFLSSFLGGLIAKSWHIPWIHIEHGSGRVETDRFLVRVFSRAFDMTIGTWIIRSADRVIGISDACRVFIESFGRKDDIPVIRRGIDFSPGERKERGDTDIHMTFIGRLTYLKGVVILIEALKKVEDIPSWVLTIVGDGELRGTLEKFAKEKGLSERIKFVGMKDRDDIAKNILPDTDIFINPSLQEGLPTVVLEALWSKCRVIATDVGGTREISDQDDLTIITPNDVNALALALRNACLDYKTNSGLSYDLLQERFDWKKSIKTYSLIIHSLI